MNQPAQIVMGVAGGMLALVSVVLILVYLAPFGGSASAGVSDTGNQIAGMLPFIGGAMAAGIALLALGRRR